MSGGLNKREDIIAEYIKLKDKGGDSSNIIKILSKKYKIKCETIQTYISKAKQFNTLPQTEIKKEQIDDDLSKNILLLVKRKKMSVMELADFFSVAPKFILAAVDSLKSKNILVNTSLLNEVSVNKELPINYKPISVDFTLQGEVEIPIGLVADTHLCSKYERLDVLNALYDRFEGYGINTVYHAGNWIDGEARFNKFDIHTYGVDSQIEYFVKNYPIRNNIKTYIISGDDHEGWYVQREGINIGRQMENLAEEANRFDLVDLGYMERNIELQREEGLATLRVIHAGGGSAYAISYTEQKYVESLQGGEKPNIILIGHYHKFNQGYPREVHTVQAGCCQDQTPFMRKKKLQAMVGGCVIWVTQNKQGILTSFKVQWIPFYDKKFYAYK